MSLLFTHDFQSPGFSDNSALEAARSRFISHVTHHTSRITRHTPPIALHTHSRFMRALQDTERRAHSINSSPLKSTPQSPSAANNNTVVIHEVPLSPITPSSLHASLVLHRSGAQEEANMSAATSHAAVAGANTSHTAVAGLVFAGRQATPHSSHSSTSYNY